MLRKAKRCVAAYFYRCPECKRELTFDRVRTMSSSDIRRPDGTVEKAFVVGYVCCAGRQRTATCIYEPTAYRRLIGNLRPVMPYTTSGDVIGFMPEDREYLARAIARCRAVKTCDDLGFKVELGSDD